MTLFAPEIFAPRLTVRDVNENAIGQLTTFSEADFIPKWNGVGTWRIKAAFDVPGAELFRAGCSITGVMPDGYLFSGQMTDLAKTKDSDNLGGGTVEVSGVHDNAILGFRMAYPDPSVGASSQTATATYNATGPLETVLRTIVALNMGPSAPVVTRRITNLALDTDQGRGPTSPVSLRFDNLLELHQRMMSPAGMGFSIVAAPGGYFYSISQTRDLSDFIRFSQGRGTLGGWSYSLKSPVLTQAAVAGQGEGTARNIRTFNDPTHPELDWGWFIEQFIDRRDTNDTLEMTQAATEAFAQNNQFAVSILPIDTDDMKFGRDYQLGDIVAAEVDGTWYTDTITQIAYQFRPNSYRAVPTIGAADAVGGRALDIYRVVRLIASRVGLLEKRF
jgi:Siphovirus ReqiPepy6 Gp37-like protein